MKRQLAFVAAGLVVVTAASMLPLFGARRHAATRSDIVTRGPLTFPAGFLWGTATAAHQIESRQPNDWTAFEDDVIAHRRVSQRAPGQAEPGHIHALDRRSEDVRARKTNHDELFREDLAAAAAMKTNAYRFSIEWSRLFQREDQREPDPAGITFYRAILDEAKRQGLTPSVTLHHFTTPQWLWQPKDGKRGFERVDALEHWERFVRAVVLAFGGDVRHWCTLNEPMVYVYSGYLEGVFPPLERRGDPKHVVTVVTALLKAHALAWRIIKEDARTRGITSMVGYTQHTRAFEPYRNWAPLDRLTATFAAQAFIWDFVDAVHTGTFKPFGTGHEETIDGLRGTQDYLGINYYGRFYLKSDVMHPTRFTVMMRDGADPDEKVNDMGWAQYPRGFFDVLAEAHRRYGLPIYVLEHGTADAKDDDALRREMLVLHVAEMWNAIQQGADVRGYFHWSLIDNFEWAEGFEQRFGLIEVDYDDGFKRTPRPSSALYARIASSNGLPAELVETFMPRQQAD